MSVINRIEVSNYLNLDNRKPSDSEWRPHWRHVVLNLRGLPAAIVATNGIGKSTTNRAIYALLSRDRTFVTESKKRAAPRRRGLWSHVRLEVVYQDATTVMAPGLFADETPGEPYVLGFYGYSDDELHFYAYRGRLENCPVVHAEGHRKTMVANAVFQETLKQQPGLVSNPPKEEWLKVVYRHFDPSLVHQLVLYQKAGGGDGAENFFKVHRKPGDDYDAAFFYTHIAPEILVNCMDAYGVEGEYRFEDTLLESARPVIRAEQLLEQRKVDVDSARNVFESLQVAKVKADEFQSAQDALARTVGEGLAEIDFLTQIVERTPLVGVPTLCPKGATTAFVADRMVCMDSHWLIPDRVLAEILDSEPKVVNREAEARRVKGATLRGSQVIENPSHLSQERPQGGSSQPNRGYGREAAIALIERREKYGPGWDLDSAKRAINYAYVWRDEEGEPNLLRRRAAELQRSLIALEEGTGRAKLQRQEFNEEHGTLQERLQTIDAAEHALSAMRQSKLFSEEELAAPHATQSAAGEQARVAQRTREAHERRRVELNEVRSAYSRVQAEFPAAVPRDLLSTFKEEAAQAQSQAEQTAHDAEAASKELRAAELAHRKASDALNGLRTTHAELELLLPKVKEFEKLFPDESPVGLQATVRMEWQKATHRDAEVAQQHSQVQAQLGDLRELQPQVAAYRERFGDEDPRPLTHRVVKDLSDAQGRLGKLLHEQQLAQGALAELEAGSEALRAVHARFAADCEVTKLEQQLADEVAELSVKRQQAEGEEQRYAPLAEALDAFGREFGVDAQPRAVADKRARRLEEVVGERDQFATKLADLELQREELESAGVGAGTLARQVLSVVGDSTPRVHEVIEALGLPPPRRAQLLTHFSHLLHAPVVADAARAHEALQALDDCGIEAALFVREGLERFCREGTLESAEEVAYSFLVGMTTLQVKALIHPAEIERLKARLDSQIASVRTQHGQAQEELDTLVESAALSVLVRNACEAADARAQEKLDEARAELQRCNARLAELKELRDEASLALIRTAAAFVTRGGGEALQHQADALSKITRDLAEVSQALPTLELRASVDSLALIDAMKRFIAAGGDEAVERLTEQLEQLAEEAAELAERLPLLAQRLENLGLIDAAEAFVGLGGWARVNGISDELEAARDAEVCQLHALETSRQRSEAAQHAKDGAAEARETTAVRLSKWQDSLANAQRFLDDDGPEFDRSFKERLEELRAEEHRADARTRFAFELAQQAVEAARDPEGHARLIERRDHLAGEVKRLDRDIEDAEERQRQGQSDLSRLRELAHQLDRAIIAILSQWREVRDLRASIPVDVTPGRHAESHFVTASRQLFVELQERLEEGELEALPELVADIAENIASFRLSHRRTEIDGFKKGASKAFKDLSLELGRVRRDHGGKLSQAEQDALLVDRDPARVATDVFQLYRHFESYLLNAERLFAKSQEDLEQHKDALVRSIAGFTDAIDENFKLLRTVLERRTAGAAGLKVDGQILEHGGISGQINDIIKNLRVAEKRRAEDIAGDRPVESQGEFDERLKRDIRDSFYRSVFRAPDKSGASGPTVTFQHSEIAGGRPVRLTEELSTGQANALALLILTKIADFTLHRDTAAEMAGIGSRKARPSSTRVVMIDGLFSNLSNKRMIRNSLSVIRTLKGSFQLIGWIHNALYENDPELFPTYIALRRVGGEHGFVLVEEGAPQSAQYEEGEVAALQFHADRLAPDAPDIAGKIKARNQVSADG